MEKEKHKEIQLDYINVLLRKWILEMTTEAGSGHPSSSLSSVELMSTLFFRGYLRIDTKNTDAATNDRIIFSKGHAAPLFYALWAAAGELDPEELNTLRQFWSRLEGHPTMHFPFTEAPTGALGQGLSIGLGMALASDRLDKVGAYTWVLLGDSEMAEGQVWEAMALASHYKAHNLIAVVDVNRLGQRGETMLGHDMETYLRRAESFGWKAVIVEDGHDTEEISRAYDTAMMHSDAPTMIFAKTVKGKGVSFLEDEEGWHGKALDKDQLAKALKEIGIADTDARGVIAKPTTIDGAHVIGKSEDDQEFEPHTFDLDEPYAVRDAFGKGLVDVMHHNKKIVVLDAEVSNSTRTAWAKEVYPDRFFEMFIAEQNMASVAVGFSRRGYVPYIASFAAFLTRAHGQIRMAQFSQSQIVCIGSHAGVSIGEDGASQMGLEDLALFRPILGSVVLYPSDAQSAYELTTLAAEVSSVVYVRTTREKTAVLYGPEEEFPIGGSKVLCKSFDDQVTIVAAGITVHEALIAYEILKEEGIVARVVDAYSIKPIDVRTLKKAAADTGAFIVVEDHYPEGGLGDAVREALDGNAVNMTHLAVRKTPRSGKTQELLAYEEIDAQAITRAVRKLL